MTNYLSKKITSISTISIIMVVYIHSYSYWSKTDWGYNFYIQHFISHGICRVAVPIFFIISGYLFFAEVNTFNIQIFSKKIKKRIRTLFIPYLFWAIYGILLLLILQSLPYVGSFFTNQAIRDFSFENIIKLIFLRPIPFPIWFIKDLFIIVLFSPFLYFALKYSGYVFIFLLFTIWFMFEEWFDLFALVEMNFLFLWNIDSLLFFSLGGVLSLRHSKMINSKEKDFAIYFFIIWIFLVCIRTTLIYQEPRSQVNYMISPFAGKIGIIFGIIAVWKMYDWCISRNKTIFDSIRKIAPYSFFIFVFHEPLLTYIKYGFKLFNLNSQLLQLIYYFILPIFVISISVVVAAFLKRNNSRLYSVMTGNR